MKLYIIKTLFLGKDLHNEAVAGFVLAENDKEVFATVSEKWAYWNERLDDWRHNDMAWRADEWEKWLIDNRGDFDDEYRGEFYDQKFAWKCLGDISDKEITVLRKFNLL